ncbi:terminase large subunit domain-containing protein [Desulforamulus ruminis]|uniref:terminase large subunit domain-containing protein n=1 Tax=Desulforamulus ruminis TaxID=1564 RepID=UPI0023559628|nr:terminase family protein [Desulforamulus ruminis]
MARTARTTQDKLKIINADFQLWAKNFVKIVDNEGKEIPFILNEQQDYFYQNMDKFNIISKSRQLGFTTYSLAYCLWLACTRSNTNCLIVSYNVESTQSIFERLKQMYASIPDKYKPGERRNNRMELLLENNSRIIVKTAGVKSLGRGMTLQYALLSEFAFYNDEQQKDTLVSLEQSLAKNEDSKIVIETTSNGYNYYQKLFMNAYKGNSKYKSFFFPWFSSATTKQFKHEIDLAEKWFRANNKGHRMEPEHLERDEIPLREKGISFKLLMWRRWKLEDISIEDFNQEYPSTPEESFKATSRSVFDTQKISERLNYIHPPLSRTDITKELPISLDSYLNKGFFIYRNVKENERYYIGVDTSSGSGGDYSAISIFNSEGQQVASFYDSKVPIYKFAQVVYDIGMYFNYGFLVVEKNSFGQSVIEKLRQEFQYLNMYKMKQFDERGRKRYKIGWVTTSVTKPKLISDFKEQFETDLILMNDNETLEEMKIFTDYNGKTGNIRGEGFHDDMVIASALAIQGIKCGKWYV